MITILKLKQWLKHSVIVKRMLSMVRQPKPMKFVSYGEEFSDRTFYVIGRDNPIAGGWSLINTTMMHMAFAHDHGYIPVVDMQNYRNQYTKLEELGKVNFWEKFFLQPAGYSLKDIIHAKHVIINSTALCPLPEYNASDGSNIWEDEKKLSKYRHIFNTYVRFNEITQKFLDAQVDKTLKECKSVIGVLCRGTDFLVNKPTGHEIQPAPEVVLSDVKEEFDKGVYDAVFLATEDQDILDLFKNTFGDNLHYLEQVRVSRKEMKGDKWLSAELEKREDKRSPEEMFLTYFSATYILTKCRCLFTGRNNGSKGVLYMPSNFDFVKIYNLGQY